ncbi:MAG: NTP transferase domain-containing protein [Deltaproteobacteria bacterium]|nr:NTP transferase domain-containing protein [Deltaproteobacteria bacterium]
MGAAKFPDTLHVLIMAGGSGTRFWPKSRSKKPKQLLALWDDKTLIEHTVERFAKHLPQKNIWIVTTEALVAPTREVLGAKYKDVRFLGEPAAKNTAACILWGTHEIARADAGATVAVMPADHYIGDEDAFGHAVLEAVVNSTFGGGLVTLGIRPNRPETGYGYIELPEVPKKSVPKAIAVKAFVEKPDLRTAIRYLESGKYVWNAGMFIFAAKTGLDAFAKTMPELAKLFNDAYSSSAGFSAAAAYGKIEKRDAVSVDYGVMEPALSKGIAVSTVPVECGWNDVGSFPALEEIDCTTKGDVVVLESHSNIVQTDTGLVALLGVNDLVVVRDGDVVLVASKERAQDVKALLEKVRAKHPEKL